MVSGQGREAPPLGLGLKGTWIELVEAGAEAEGELVRFHLRRRLTPAMGSGARTPASPFAPPMLIRSLRDGAIVGSVENHALPGGVATVVIYLDPDLGRAGFGLEAAVLYISHLFDSGARLVSADVLSFNAPIIGIMRKAGWQPQARLREHVYAAGRLWDVLVYSFDRESWSAALKRHARRLPGGDLRPAALGRRGGRAPGG